MALGGIFNLMLNKTKSTSQHTPIYPSKMRTEQDKAKVQTKLDFFFYFIKERTILSGRSSIHKLPKEESKEKYPGQGSRLDCIVQINALDSSIHHQQLRNL